MITEEQSLLIQRMCEECAAASYRHGQADMYAMVRPSTVTEQDRANQKRADLEAFDRFQHYVNSLTQPVEER